METQDRNTANPAEASRPANRGSSDNRGGRAFAGLVVVAIGSLLLARELGADIPRGIVWPSIFLGIGLFIGVRHSFRGFVWAIFMMIGGAMMLDRFYPWADISDFIWPVAIIT
ncbi:MAG: LiaF transmembrane domain-containing protein, partial [Bacteroidota bacterium]